MTPRYKGLPIGSGAADLEPDAIQQLKNACKLPVAVSGALMPDAHVGYGLPIGGVLATHDAVIPYAVGVDIACRMKMTRARSAGERARRRSGPPDTSARAGNAVRHGRDVLGRRGSTTSWTGIGDVTPVTSKMKDRAWAQLGTSGSGNHFVEFGELTVER